MTEETAFLEALNEKPDDLTLRQVFADWLEERGDPCGELLRLTHMLTRSIGVPQREELEGRLQTLVDDGTPSIGPFRTNCIDMSFAWIPPGIFAMGSPRDEKGRTGYEVQHEVTLTKGFFFGVHPVTRAQWHAVMGNTNTYRDFQVRVPSSPVDAIPWNDAIAFCNRVSEMESRQLYYRIEAKTIFDKTVFPLEGDGYRLPTEAEWEHACRAGSSSAYCFGNVVSKLDEYGWHVGNAYGQLKPVGLKKPNAWGLCDMHGHVQEWCWDWYNLCSIGSTVDPQNSTRGTQEARMLRGGSSSQGPAAARSAFRSWSHPQRGYEGLRLCFSLE